MGYPHNPHTPHTGSAAKSTCYPNLKFLGALGAEDPLGGHIGDK